MNSASPLEIFWTLMTGAGTLVQFYSLLDALADDRTRRRAKLNGIRRELTMSGVRTEGALWLGQLAFFALGLIAFTLPPSASPTLSGIVIQILLISVATVFFVTSLANLFARRRIRRAFEAAPPKRRKSDS